MELTDRRLNEIDRIVEKHYNRSVRPREIAKIICKKNPLNSPEEYIYAGYSLQTKRITGHTRSSAPSNTTNMRSGLFYIGMVFLIIPFVILDLGKIGILSFVLGGLIATIFGINETLDVNLGTLEKTILIGIIAGLLIRFTMAIP